MRPLSLSSISLLHEVFSPPIGGVAGLAAAALTAPARGEESCVPAAADGADGERICAQTDVKIDGDDEDDEGEDEEEDDDEQEGEDGDGIDDDDDDGIVDDANNAEERTKRPYWWDFNIDELFEDYFDCGAIIYGYGDIVYAFDKDDKDNDDGNLEEDYEINHEKRKGEHDDPVSDLQLHKIRHQWAVIREKYVKEVNLVPVEIEFFEGTDSLAAGDVGGSDGDIIEAIKINNRGVSSMVVPSHVGDAGPGKGRGVFATEPIPKGTLVVDLDNGSTGVFKEGHPWREFAVSLPRETACNFIEWSWVQDIPPGDDDDDVRNGLTILVSFDESNLMNAADWDGVEANVRCGRPPEEEGGEWGPCRFHYYAARDIDAGEELLLKYGEFEDIDQTGWTNIGL